MTEPHACLNCGEPFGDVRPRYCPACGQETNVKPPTLLEFAQQFGGSYIAAEGALWRSLRLLLFKPGEITREYLAGRRRRYVLPLRLYLTISVLVLLALRVAGSSDVKIDFEGRGRDPDKSLNLTLLGGRAGLKEGVFYCEGLPPGLCHRLQARMDLDAKGLAREAAASSQRFVSNLGAAMFVLLPLFAALLKLLYWPRHMRYTEHLVFALHLHAFWFLALGLLITQVGALAVAALVAAPAYALLALRRVYGGRWWALLLRATFLALTYSIAIGLALALLALWVLLF
mgnify:FL=1